MKDVTATVYVICVYLWGAFCIGGCSYIVFWKEQSGWWFVLAIAATSNNTANSVAKIRGIWKKEMEDE